jgi:hypothetical protein
VRVSWFSSAALGLHPHPRLPFLGPVLGAVGREGALLHFDPVPLPNEVHGVLRILASTSAHMLLTP